MKRGGDVQEMMDRIGQSMASSKQTARGLMKTLGIDPLLDFETTWVVEEFRACEEQPLPEGWKQVTHLDGGVHYINQSLGADTLVHPATRRFERLVRYLKYTRDAGVPVNDLLVLELLEPVSDPGDVMRMCRRLEINPIAEAHLTWIAKKAVLEGLSDGWQR